MSALTKHQAALRARALTISEWLIAHQLIEGYTEARPYARPKYPPTRYFANDCSGTLLLIFEWTGIPKPDGGAWGYGNTATLINALRAYHVPMDTGKWQPLDYVFYGNPWAGGPGGHVAMLTHKDDRGRWHVISHGSPSGPKDELAFYRNPVAIRRYRIPRK
jgi:hypothetical protein